MGRGTDPGSIYMIVLGMSMRCLCAELFSDLIYHGIVWAHVL